MSQVNKSSSQLQRLIIPRAIVEDLANALCMLLIDSLSREELVDVKQQLTPSQRKSLLHLGDLMTTYEVIPDKMNDQLQTLVKRVQEQEYQEYVTFSTRCPYCGQDGDIRVIQVIFTQINETLDVDVPLQSDGFDVFDYCPSNAEDLSTEDERVRCNTCQTEFDLSELFLS